MVVHVARDDHPPASPRSSAARPLYGVMLTAWLLLPASIMVFLVMLGLERARHEFEEHAGHLNAELTARLRSNDAALGGFAAFLALAGSDERAEVVHYAAAVLRRNPHIHALEVVDEVRAARVGEFRQQMLAAGHRDVVIRDFDHEGTRRWLPAAPRATYYPLSVVVLREGSLDELLGMDVGQVSALNKALLSAVQGRGPFTSEPFQLYEGGTGYGIFQRVEPVAVSTTPRAFRSLALILVRVEELLPPSSLPEEYNFHVSVVARNGLAEGATPLLDYPSAPVGWLAPRLLPTLRYVEEIEESLPRVTLTVERQLEWDDINLPLIARMMVVALITFALLHLYARAHRRSEVRRLELEALLHYKAHHDELTGLPNRALIIDRIEQAIRHAQRNSESLALLFLDLDGFKPVNDTFGHEAGDAVLCEVAQRLRTVVREQDTVGRMSGDEFIMVLTDTDRAGAQVVNEKIQSVFQPPFTVAPGQSMLVGISAGVAIHPQDGATTHELMRVADSDMYRHKHGLG